MRASIVIGVLCWLVPTVANASPWTLKRGELGVVTGFNYQFSDSEFLDNSDSRPFPLRGDFISSELFIDARFGFTDTLEFELYVPVKAVGYESDPVILLPQPEDDALDSIDYYQENIIKLSRTDKGVGDVTLSVRKRWIGGSMPVATEVRFKTPTGYTPPSGTFGDRPSSSEELAADLPRFVRPANVRDDVTLGDGQVDVGWLLLAGFATPQGTFVRFDGGYNLRLGGAGDELMGALKAGHTIDPAVLVYVGAQGSVAIQDGRLIGVSVAAEDPTLPAEDYGGAENLRLREVTLDRDALDVGGGIILRLGTAELNLGYARTVWGRNTAVMDSLFISVGVRVDTTVSPQ